MTENIFLKTIFAGPNFKPEEIEKGLHQYKRVEFAKITFEDFKKLFSIEAFREVGRTQLVSSFSKLKTNPPHIVLYMPFLS